MTLGLVDVTASSLEDAKRGRAKMVEEITYSKPHILVRASVNQERNEITLESERVSEMRIRLVPGLIRFDRPLKVLWNRKVVFNKRVTPSIRALLEEARASGRRDHAVPAMMDLKAPLSR